MLVAATVAGTVGVFLLLLLTALFLGVPIVGTIKRNQRTAEVQADIARTAHMEGWVPGSTLAFRARAFDEGGGGGETPGPFVIDSSVNPAGAWVRIVNGPVPQRPDFSRLVPVGDPLAVLRDREAAGEAGGDSAPATSAQGGVPDNGSGGGAVTLATAVGFRPPDRPDLDEGFAEAMVLGCPALVGCLVEPDRAKVIELGCYLALHNARKMRRNEVIDAVWSGEDPEKSAGTLRNMMWMLRQAWGEELVPNATHGLYGLSKNVTTDWQRFRDLVADASGGEEIDVLTRALTLLRGMPFEGVPDGSYGWADVEMFSSDMENVGRRAAHRLARLTLVSGEFDHARWATEKGLVVSPYDRELWTVLMEIAEKRGPAEVARVSERARGALGEDVRELDAAVGKLRATG